MCSPTLSSFPYSNLCSLSPVTFLHSCFLAFLHSCFLAFLLSCILAFLLCCLVALVPVLHSVQISHAVRVFPHSVQISHAVRVFPHSVQISNAVRVVSRDVFCACLFAPFGSFFTLPSCWLLFHTDDISTPFAFLVLLHCLVFTF
jgi:hypothetical protein